MKDIIKDNIPKMFIAFLLILVGVIGRLTLSKLLPSSPSLYLNLNGMSQPLFMIDLFFLMAIVTILSALFLKSYHVFFVPLSVLLITDIILGNNYIFLFTWSGFVVIGLLFYLLKSKNKFTIKKTPLLFGTSIGSVLLYDTWTNLGCYIGWYPHTIEGLSMCFTVALPFMLWHILSTTVAFALIVLPVLYIKEKELIKIDCTVKPIEKPVALSLLSVTMVLSILFSLV